MARRRDDGLLELLVLLPWWVSIIVSASCYIGLVYILPVLAADSVALAAISTGLARIAYIFALILLLPAPLSYWSRRRKRRLLDTQKDAESIRLLSWREFEWLLAEAYRRKGYSVVENSRAGPDGGVDIRLYKDGKAHLVQCKHWKSQKVGVSVVREMLGLVTAEDAAGAIVVTSGSFTHEARKFAQDQAVDLIDGSQLYELISSVQEARIAVRAEDAVSIQRETKENSKNCPSCGSELVVRIARKGNNSGNLFYGCASFPRCRYTEPA